MQPLRYICTAEHCCLVFQIAPPGKLESGFQTSSSLSYTPSPSSPSGGVYTIGGGSPLPHNGDGIFDATVLC